MTEQEIHDICNKYDIKNYTINADGSIDVYDTVYLSNNRLINIPVKFNKVSGGFYCNNNNLTSLEGCPSYVGGSFYCYGNNLTSLVGCPNYIGGSFYCFENKLTSLEGCPKEVGVSFVCGDNPLESFEGYKGDFNRLVCLNKIKLIRKTKLKIIEKL